MIKIIIQLVAFYLLYKLVFDFIIPVFKTTNQVKKQFKDVQEKMNQFNQQETASTSENINRPKTAPSREDYIDFEEIK